MNVLFVTYDFPFPTNSGGKTRAYNLIKQKGKDINLTLFSFIRNNFDDKSKKHMLDIGVKKIVTVERNTVRSLSGLTLLADPRHSIFHKLYFNKNVAEKMKSVILDEKIDIVHFESYYTGFYMNNTLSQMGVKQIFGTENIEANVYEDYIRMNVLLPLRPLYRFENSKIRREEEEMMKRCGINLAVTPSEKKYIESISKKPVVVIENGVDVDYFSFQLRIPSSKVTILFVGSFSYHPNVDAAEYFYTNIFTKLDPEKYTFRVIGKKAQSLSFAKKRSVSYSEYVEDIRTEYHRADVFVSPVRLGGGTNFKILESMAVGLPVVAFANRLSDLGVISKKELLIAHSDEEFVKMIEEIVSDTELRKSVAKNAREFIEEKYSWKTIGRKMNEVWRSLKN